MTLWTDPHAPRIWRSPEALFDGDEPLDASRVYRDDVLAGIASHGFNGVWLRGRLYELMRSTVLPGLNDPRADERIISLRTVIERGCRHGAGVYLFFNEPLGLPEDHPLWREHPQLKGEPYYHPVKRTTTAALCTSSPLAMRFFRQAVKSVLDALPGLAGVILITASERHSHCWSHLFRRSLNDGVNQGGAIAPRCARCRDREPAEVVLELIKTWRDAARSKAPVCRVLAWNWSWSMWYDDPQAEVVGRLPEGVDLLMDFERGGSRSCLGRPITVDEYALSYVGPSERFCAGRVAAPASAQVFAKLQIGTTHEIATVPNLPLPMALHAKFTRMCERGVAGTMACWNFGCALTLNSFALGLYCSDPARYVDQRTFLIDLAEQYFSLGDVGPVLEAWRQFDAAFTHYPFDTAFLYFSPVNDAPAHPLSLRYEARPLGPSWLEHELGDDVRPCLGRFTAGEVHRALTDLAAAWRAGIADYTRGLEDSSAATDPAVQAHRVDELRCARMIGLQMRSAAHFFGFHARRLALVDHGGPCELPPDARLLELMHAEVANARAALPLVEADPRLGWHQESHVVMYDAGLIGRKIADMERELRAVGMLHV